MISSARISLRDVCRSAVGRHAAVRRHSLPPTVLPADIAWSATRSSMIL